MVLRGNRPDLDLALDRVPLTQVRRRRQAVLPSVQVRKIVEPAACDLCEERAQMKMTNGRFFILITCVRCWGELQRVADPIARDL